MADGEPFTLAGLWENWKDPDSGEWQRTFTIVTREANELVAKLHDRMPVVVAPEDRDSWLSEDPHDLLRPYAAQKIRMSPVSRDVNSPKNDRRDLLDPVSEAPWLEADNDDIEDANSRVRKPGQFRTSTR
jgi:putative SOS response-associated peptidase YedK